MIEPMANVTVVCLRQDRQATVERLRELGSVHVRPVRAPESAELGDLERRRQQLERALAILAMVKADRQAVPADVTALTSAALADEVLRLTGVQAQAEEERTRLGQQAAQLAPWGSFSATALESIRSHGVQVILGVASRGQLPVLPAGAVLYPIRERDGMIYFAVVAESGSEVNVTPAPLPDLTDAAELARRQTVAGQAAAEAGAALAALRPALGRLQQAKIALEGETRFLQARDGMGEHGDLVYLRGYVPVCRTSALNDAARSCGWGVRLVEPESDDAEVPTCITLPRWVEPIRCVIEGIGLLPGYREVDISACFLVFFSIFFAILIGDAAYGVLMLAAIVFLRRKYPQAPAQPFWLFGIMAVSTIIWGTLSGTWFGLEPRFVPDVLESLSWGYLTDPKLGEHNVQKLCFLIGVIHLTIAHAWKFWLNRRSLGALAEVSWALVLWGNYFLAANLVLDDPTPVATKYLYIAGMTGIVFFSEPQRNLFKTVGLGLKTLVLGIVNSFIDVVSYIRLFAVGVAGLAIEQSFTGMALGTGLPGWLAAPAGALILIAGHALNMTLGSLGVLVHGVRLNVLEFAGSHMGMQFTGVAYRPLKLDEANGQP